MKDRNFMTIRPTQTTEFDQRTELVVTILGTKYIAKVNPEVKLIICYIPYFLYHQLAFPVLFQIWWQLHTSYHHIPYFLYHKRVSSIFMVRKTGVTDSVLWSNSVLRFSINSVLWSKIWSFGFLFIWSSGFCLPYQFVLFD